MVYPHVLLIADSLSAFVVAQSLFDVIPNQIVVLFKRSFHGSRARCYHRKIQLPNLEDAVFEWLNQDKQSYLFVPTSDRCLKLFSFKRPINLILPPNYSDLQYRLCKYFQFNWAVNAQVDAPEHLVINSNTPYPGDSFAIKLKQRDYSRFDKWRFVPLTQEIWKEVLSLPVEIQNKLMLTRIVPHGGNIFTVQGVVHKGTVIASFTAVKRLSMPHPTGVFVECVTCHLPELIKIANKLFELTSFTSIFEIEFVLNLQSQKYELLDVNLKPTLWLSIADYAKMPIVSIYFQCLTGTPPEPIVFINDGISILNCKTWISSYFGIGLGRLGKYPAKERYYLFTKPLYLNQFIVDVFSGVYNAFGKRKKQFLNKIGLTNS